MCMLRPLAPYVSTYRSRHKSGPGTIMPSQVPCCSTWRWHLPATVHIRSTTMTTYVSGPIWWLSPISAISKLWHHGKAPEGSIKTKRGKAVLRRLFSLLWAADARPRAVYAHCGFDLQTLINNCLIHRRPPYPSTKRSIKPRSAYQIRL
jgi:hypothetical protein